MFPLTIPAGEGSPTLVIHANLLHNLYHYLSKHEATHVADVHSLQQGKRSFSNKVMEHLSGTEFHLSAANAWNVWHAIIFASSAYQVRTCIDSGHIDYALPRNIYAQFGVPDLPTLWRQFATQEIDEQEFLKGIAHEHALGLRSRPE